MQKSNRIIVLVDLTENTENLVAFAFQLAEIVNGKVVMVHQIPQMVPAMADQEVRDQINQGAINEAREKMKDLSKGRIYGRESLVVSIKPVLHILTEMQSGYYNDWVLGGLKEGTLLKRMLFGSTLVTVVNDTDFLTLAIPVSQSMSFPEKLVVAVTSEFPLNELQLNTLLTALQGQIKVVEFITILQDDEDEDIAKSYLMSLDSKYYDYNTKTLLLKGMDKFDELKKHVEQSPDIFLVLQEGRRSFLDRLFRKFMINDLIHSANIPLIILSK